MGSEDGLAQFKVDKTKERQVVSKKELINSVIRRKDAEQAKAAYKSKDKNF